MRITGPDRVLLAAIGALLILAIVAAAVASRQSATQLPADTAQAAVQRYVDRVLAGDTDAAAAELDPSGACTVEDLRDNASSEDITRVLLRSTEQRADGQVVVTLSLVSGSGVAGGDGWGYDQEFTLRQHDGRWVITGDPWPLYACGKDLS